MFQTLAVSWLWETDLATKGSPGYVLIPAALRLLVTSHKLARKVWDGLGDKSLSSFSACEVI